MPGRAPIARSAPRLLARGLLLFWALWLSAVVGSNLADGLVEAGQLPPGWAFASGNLALIADSLAVYSLSRAWAATLFAGAVALELATAALFWRAFLDAEPLSRRAGPSVLAAFGAGIALFAGFLLFDELLVVYRRLPSLESTHFLVLCALLLSLLVVRALGE